MKRADFMNTKDKTAMGELARTHENCFRLTGKKRPGKTAFELFKKGRANRAD